jgi:hypothetical protein
VNAVLVSQFLPLHLLQQPHLNNMASASSLTSSIVQSDQLGLQRFLTGFHVGNTVALGIAALVWSRNGGSDRDLQILILLATLLVIKFSKRYTMWLMLIDTDTTMRSVEI